MLAQAMCWTIFTLGFGMRMNFSLSEGLIYFTSHISPCAVSQEQKSTSSTHVGTPPEAEISLTEQETSLQGAAVDSQASGTGPNSNPELEPLLDGVHKSGLSGATEAEQAPIVFLHGVGCGFLLYIDWMRRLVALGECQPILKHECDPQSR